MYIIYIKIINIISSASLLYLEKTRRKAIDEVKRDVSTGMLSPCLRNNGLDGHKYRRAYLSFSPFMDIDKSTSSILLFSFPSLWIFSVILYSSFNIFKLLNEEEANLVNQTVGTKSMKDSKDSNYYSIDHFLFIIRYVYCIE